MTESAKIRRMHWGLLGGLIFGAAILTATGCALGAAKHSHYDPVYIPKPGPYHLGKLRIWILPKAKVALAYEFQGLGWDDG